MDQILVAINQWLTGAPVLALPAAFLWGMVAVLLSPCHMASIPLFIAYVAGQKIIPPPRRAVLYAVLFAAGLFITIMVVGVVCALAGRMLGDVGPGFQVAVGILLLYVAWTLWRPARCSSGRLMGRLQVQGPGGAFLLGLAYGFLSGACTFGFIAPILALITVQQEIVTGVVMLALFGVGHCLPLIACGVFSARTMELLHSRGGQRTVAGLRRLAAVVIVVLGVYFSINPFL